MRVKAISMVVLMITFSLVGCLSNEEPFEEPIVEVIEDPRIFVTDKTGNATDVAPLDMIFQFSDVGETGKEPSIGVTSSGCIFFIAMEKVMRSCDGGELRLKPKTLSNVHLQLVTLMDGSTQLLIEYSMCK